MRSREFKELAKKYKTSLHFSALYYPRANPTESVNGTLETMIRSFIKDNHRQWDENLTAIGCALRTAVHETIGYSPYFVNFVREHKISGEQHRTPFRESTDPDVIKFEVEHRILGYRQMYAKNRQRLRQAQERNRRRYNLQRRNVTFNIRDSVWRKNKVY